MDLLVQLRARGLGACGVVGEIGGDLDADEAIAAVAVVVHWREHVERAVDVCEHQRPVVVDDRVVAAGQRAELVVVVGRALDRLLEDRRVAGEAADALVDEVAELARGDVAALEVVEPRALPELVVQVGETIHDLPLCLSQARGALPRRWRR